MAYAEIIITSSIESKEAIMNRLTELGALGFVDGDDTLTAYFNQELSPLELSDELARFRYVLESSDLDASFSFSHHLLPDRDWNESWKKNFTPIDVGERLVIVPSWLRPETGRVPIIIDPGMVFGTGHHETTRTCLSILERIAKNKPPGSFLDIGTGTGILAIGAARLGFVRIIAVDIDPLAVDAARRNIRENALEHVEACEGDISAVSGRFDVIAANLLSEILIEIAPDLASRLNPGGATVISGMLSGQEDGVIESMRSAGFSLQEKVMDGKWISLVLSRTGST